ncbi:MULTISPECIES: SPOR domain-containing protein [Ferrimonas]|uniref:SPOR domain-containing protein n=1 Tax=Ferrimonas TaxID=44011 RepID=UPI0003FBBA0E|nr:MULTISPECIES: SPOR domain-containing protein [Ferrimonas]USD36657.1 SPOR domain-containing protein [Ferrimonas sp. SCSIO 43195]
MSAQLKNRIVGTLVLTALAVIFLPDLLSGEKQRVQENFATIPLRPVSLPEPVPEQAFDDVALSDTKVQKEAVKPTPSNAPAAEPASKPAAKPAATEIRQGWTIQLGTFKNAKNVNNLVNQLRDQGFRAYTVPARPVEGRLNRVFVGPDISKDALMKEKARLAKLTELNGSLVRYKATDI